MKTMQVCCKIIKTKRVSYGHILHAKRDKKRYYAQSSSHLAVQGVNPVTRSASTKHQKHATFDCFPSHTGYAGRGRRPRSS